MFAGAWCREPEFSGGRSPVLLDIPSGNDRPFDILCFSEGGAVPVFRRSPMEGLTRLVAESMARLGLEPAVDHRRLQWSLWFRCESSFDLLLIPAKPGLFAVGEEILAPGELPVASGKRMLAIIQV